MGYEEIAWLPLCAGLTAFGLLATWLVGRRRGAAAVTRGVAWSLIPVAAYLTGLIELVWTVAGASVSWALRLVFSPIVWAGVVVAGLSAILFVVSGILRGRGQPARGREVEQGGEEPKSVEKEPSGAQGSGDDLADVEEILRRRGIT